MLRSPVNVTSTSPQAIQTARPAATPYSHFMDLSKGEKILEMQSRHPDGSSFARGEFDKDGGTEEMALWILADSYLVQWLGANQGLSKKANWFTLLAIPESSGSI